MVAFVHMHYHHYVHFLNSAATVEAEAIDATRDKKNDETMRSSLLACQSESHVSDQRIMI
jgi:hypothetical protein